MSQNTANTGRLHCSSTPRNTLKIADGSVDYSPPIRKNRLYKYRLLGLASLVESLTPNRGNLPLADFEDAARLVLHAPRPAGREPLADILAGRPTAAAPLIPGKAHWPLSPLPSGT